MSSETNLPQRKIGGTLGLAIASVALLVSAVIHFIMSTQPGGPDFDRVWAWINQCFTFALCLGALVCSCMAAIKAFRAKPPNLAADAVTFVLAMICLFMVLLASIGVLANGEILFFGGSEHH